MKTLHLDEKLLKTSHVAARLNGYLVGVGGVKQYTDEASSLGLNAAQKEYVRHYVEENEGGNLYCWARWGLSHNLIDRNMKNKNKRTTNMEEKMNARMRADNENFINLVI